MATRSLVALAALNFFMDVRDGLGPFLGVYLQAHDWSPAQIGTVMTIGGLAGMAATTPAGILVDNTHAKRAVMAAAALAVIAASLALLALPGFVLTATTQVVSGVAGAVIPAAIAAITLGIVRQKGYAHQLGHNEAFNHAGNLTAAVLAGAFGYMFGLGAVLPLLGQSLVAQGAGDPSAYTGATVVVAQLTMIPMAILAARLAEQRGYWIVFLLALIALPIRGIIAATVTGPIGLGPVQMLDGVGAGLLGVAVPGLVARILAGTGHVNAGLGAVMACQGIGAALSPALGGVMAERLGYSSAFLVLGGIALFALVVWVVTHPVTADACGAPSAALAPAAAK